MISIDGTLQIHLKKIGSISEISLKHQDGQRRSQLEVVCVLRFDLKIFHFVGRSDKQRKRVPKSSVYNKELFSVLQISILVLGAVGSKAADRVK